MARQEQLLRTDGGTNRLRRRAVAAILLMLLLIGWSVLDLQKVFGFADVAMSADFVHAALRVSTFVCVLALAVYLIFKSDRPQLDNLHVGSPKLQAELDAGMEIFKAERYCLRVYTDEVSRLFTAMLANLPSYLFRINEDIKLGHGNLEATTTLHLRMQPSVDDEPIDCEKAETILVPVIMARKGLLFDNLLVKDASGRVLPTLSQWETRGLTALAVRALFGFIDEAPPPRPTWLDRIRRKKVVAPEPDDELLTAFVEIVRDAICLVGSPTMLATQESARGLNDRRDRALDRLADLRAKMPDGLYQRLSEVCRSLADNYLIIAEVPKPSGTNLIVQYTAHTQNERSLQRGKEKLRARLGLDPHMLDIAMPRMLQADSYHCQITAPTGLHVFSHHLEALGGKTPLKQENFQVGGVQQYVRLYHEESRTVAHLYVRRHGAAITTSDVRRAKGIGSGVKSVLSLRETPPGMLGSAATLATVVATIVLFLTVTRLGLAGDQTTGSSLPGLLFAVPAFIAAALGRGVDGSRLSQSSLITYFGLLLVFITSISATLLYALDAAKRLPTEVMIELWPSAVFWPTDWIWLGLSLVTWGVAIFLIRERRDQTRYYLANLQRAGQRQSRRNVSLTPADQPATLTGR
ncbi:hypothetical protein KIPE111705_42865 [Kibdelosporangium persicum]|uniref:Uncharacterized protein n=1 Tax=Kibdelosporangium persicum TaxID=2698649 RepID=A0ABX2F4S4_9PSEU|nr:hypothetical protein [Kibdelosporangium persicum]NRN66321.1 hypothetical protein [Kibdelosporangium persicum]